MHNSVATHSVECLTSDMTGLAEFMNGTGFQVGYFEVNNLRDKSSVKNKGV